jgi:hypothetical protein
MKFQLMVGRSGVWIEPRLTKKLHCPGHMSGGCHQYQGVPDPKLRKYSCASRQVLFGRVSRRMRSSSTPRSMAARPITSATDCLPDDDQPEKMSRLPWDAVMQADTLCQPPECATAKAVRRGQPVVRIMPTSQNDDVNCRSRYGIRSCYDRHP